MQPKPALVGHDPGNIVEHRKSLICIIIYGNTGLYATINGIR
jgi:hypothetical protein